MVSVGFSGFTVKFLSAIVAWKRNVTVRVRYRNTLFVTKYVDIPIYLHRDLIVLSFEGNVRYVQASGNTGFSIFFFFTVKCS